MMMKQKKYKTKYAGSRGKGVTVTLPFDPRKGVCQACGKSKERGEIKYTVLHHWYYEFQPKTVKKNPILVLKNTSELCYYCHQLADAIRALLYAHPKRVAQVAELLEGKQREKFVTVLVAVEDAMEKTEKLINPLAKRVVEMVQNGKK
jgi:hypothetical protein